jgi:hypothetical protein
MKYRICKLPQLTRVASFELFRNIKSNFVGLNAGKISIDCFVMTYKKRTLIIALPTCRIDEEIIESVGRQSRAGIKGKQELGRAQTTSVVRFYNMFSARSAVSVY